MTRMRWPYVVPAGWFVLVVLASGLLALIQSTVGGDQVPLQTGARLVLLGLVLVAMAATSRRTSDAKEPLALPVGLFILTAVLSFIGALFGAPSVQEAVDSFLFMYGIGILLLVFLLAPVVVRPSWAFGAFCAAALGFGLLQTLRQDLLLPPAFRAKFGIVYDTFINENIRVLSFFASPPRFAELLVFMASYVQHGLLTGRRRNPVSIVVYITILFVLYNTFSRSGYILFVSTLLLQLCMTRKQVNGGGKHSAVFRLYAVIAAVGMGLVALIARRVPSDLSIVDATSLEARQGHWAVLIAQLREGGATDVLIGTGKSAHFSVLSPEYFVVDNLLLAIYLYSGLIGLIAFAYLYVRIFREGLQMRAKGDHARWDPILAFYVCLLAEGLFVDNHNTVFITQFVILGMMAWDRLSLGDGVPEHSGSPFKRHARVGRGSML
jgi:hypothetical protein